MNFQRSSYFISLSALFVIVYVLFSNTWNKNEHLFEDELLGK